MNFDAIENEINMAIYEQFELWRKRLPYKTGNLSRNAFKIQKVEEGYKIYIDLPIAPYAEYIDRPDYKTYKYWEKSMKEFMDALALSFNSSIK